MLADPASPTEPAISAAIIIVPAEHWTFLTNYSHVLLTIASEPVIRLRDVAARVGITERAAQRIVADLVESGYLAVEKVGRRNRYLVNARLPLRHPIERENQVSALLGLLRPDRSGVFAETPRAARSRRARSS